MATDSSISHRLRANVRSSIPRPPRIIVTERKSSNYQDEKTGFPTRRPLLAARGRIWAELPSRIGGAPLASQALLWGPLPFRLVALVAILVAVILSAGSSRRRTLAGADGWG